MELCKVIQFWKIITTKKWSLKMIHVQICKYFLLTLIMTIFSLHFLLKFEAPLSIWEIKNQQHPDNIYWSNNQWVIKTLILFVRAIKKTFCKYCHHYVMQYNSNEVGLYVVTKLARNSRLISLKSYSITLNKERVH